MAAKFDINRTFGIEIEIRTSGLTQYQIARALRDNGIDASDERYNHTTRSYWKVITDASCGFELVSPVLSGFEGLEQIKTVCKVLNELGAKVDKKCGLHVHHGVSDFELKHFKNLFIFYGKFEEAIDSILPRSRRANNAYYCGSMMGTFYNHYTYEQYVETIKSQKSISDIMALYSTRYKKLNIQSFTKYGTIEVRHHSGTTDADKIINWVILTQLMITKAKNSRVSAKKAEGSNYDNILSLLWNLDIYRKGHDDVVTGVANFYKARALEFTPTGLMRRAA